MALDLGLLLAVADGGQAGLGHAQAGQVGLGGMGAALAQGQVVFDGAALVAVAGDLDLGVRIGLEEVGDGLELGLVGLADVRLVEVEVDVLEGGLGGGLELRLGGGGLAGGLGVGLGLAPGGVVIVRLGLGGGAGAGAAAGAGSAGAGAGFLQAIPSPRARITARGTRF